METTCCIKCLFMEKMCNKYATELLSVHLCVVKQTFSRVKAIICDMDKDN